MARSKIQKPVFGPRRRRSHRGGSSIAWARRRCASWSRRGELAPGYVSSLSATRSARAAWSGCSAHPFGIPRPLI